MKRRPVIAGNWKMNISASAAPVWANQFKAIVARVEDVEIVVAAPFTTLPALCGQLLGTGIHLAGQNMHWEDSGAFTGEVSSSMLTDLGCQHVILGHSERRAMFGETNQTVNRKLFAALKAGLVPILCVGETLEQREAGITEALCREQVEASLADITPEQLEGLILAYEPVWAIGTGRTASPQDAQDVIGFLRKILGENFGPSAERVRILYGGSVKPDNIAGLMGQPDIDGALVGGASLDPEVFASISRFGG